MSVIFDQLRVADDGKFLYIDAHVSDASYFESRYIKHVIIKTAGQVSESEISPSASDGDNVYSTTLSGTQREVHLALQPVDLNEHFGKNSFSSDLFFVYVVCEETTPNECTPCELSNLTTLGTTFDTNLLYQKMLDYSRELADDCNVPDGFVDFILGYHALDAAIQTGHYIPAIKFWNQLFDMSYGYNGGSTNGSKGCGCHG